MKLLPRLLNGIKKLKKIEIVLFIIVVTGIIGSLLLFDSFNHDLGLDNKRNSNNWIKKWTMSNHPELYFDYLHGLWLMPIGIMTVFTVIMLQMVFYPERFI